MRYELTSLQQTFPWAAPKFAPQRGDKVTVPKDSRLVGTSVPMTLPAPLVGTSVDCYDPAVVWDNTMQGYPMMACTEDMPVKTVKVGTIDKGYVNWSFPAPPELWIEGHPRTRVWPWQEAPGGYDRHVILCYPTRTIELIYYDRQQQWAAGACEFDVRGNAVSGMPVTRAGVQLSKYTTRREDLDIDVVAGITLPEVSGGDGTLPPDLPFPREGQHVRLATVPVGLTGDALKMANKLHRSGAVIVDQNGKGKDGRVLLQSGTQWSGSNISTLRFGVDRLELVTETV